MLSAAAVFIYFNDPIYIRIVAGVIFLIGIGLLYRSLSGTVEEAELEIREDSGAAETQIGNTASIPGAAATEQTELRQKSQGDWSTAPAPAIDRSHDHKEIPPEYYLPREDELPTDDPRAEFDYLTKKILQVLRENLLAHTVGMFWINRDREQIIIGEFSTDSRNFTTARRLNLGSDLISRIGIQEKPEVLSDISAASEADMAVYYDSVEGIRSFVGAPLFFNGEVIAVVAADSKVADSFGLETVSVIGKVTALIATLLNSYNQKFDLAADSRLLAVLDEMQGAIQSNMDTYGISSAAARAVTEILDWDYIAVILHNPERQAWVVVKSLSKSANLPYISEGVTVDLDRSLLKPVVEQVHGQILDTPDDLAFRFHEKEAISSKGQICAVPLVTPRKYYGLVVVEYRENHQYAQRDLDVLSRIASLAANAIEINLLSEQTRKHLLIDEETRTASRTLLLQRLFEEQHRSRDHGFSSVFFLAKLDDADELSDKYGRHGITHIMNEIGGMLREQVKDYDVVGRFDPATFGLLLIQCSAEEAYLRGEKIR